MQTLRGLRDPFCREPLHTTTARKSWACVRSLICIAKHAKKIIAKKIIAGSLPVAWAVADGMLRGPKRTRRGGVEKVLFETTR